MLLQCSSDEQGTKDSKRKKKGKSAKIELKNAADSASYAIGVLSGEPLGDINRAEPLNLDVFMAGISHSLNYEETKMSKQDCQMFLQSYMMELSTKISEMNQEEGDEFLEKNKKAKGIQVTESGLQYKVVKEGTGKSPKITDKVKCHYEGKLVSGKIFDSSYERGRPTDFFVNRVIPGWSEGLQLMKEGATYMFYVPSNLAYGERAPQSIGPNQALIFKVELLEVLENDQENKVQLPKPN
jgi:FKBP-type peptidyl-prolyl cis-trans isomerase